MHDDITSAAATEVARGERFGFGENWRRYLAFIDEDRIEAAEESLRGMLNAQDLVGRTWLDVGSGSGLFSLAARRLGARVVSFDYDAESVACTRALRATHYAGDRDWEVHHGSVLDPHFMATLPQADVVYSWGVLHHTGAMYDAVRSAANKVGERGLFFLALYRKTVFCPAWALEKRFYNWAPERVRAFIRGAWESKTRLACRIKGRDFDRMVREYVGAGGRGMDYRCDQADWLGGYPYESITPRECRRFLADLGFSLVRENAKTQGVALALSSSCDEWLFRRA